MTTSALFLNFIMIRTTKMSIQEKKINLSSKDPTLKGGEKNQRPNIDHLIKRILVERRQERNNNLLLTGVSILGFITMILFFTLN